MMEQEYNQGVLYDLCATQPSFGSSRHGGGKYGEIVLKQILRRDLPVTCFYDSRRWLNPEISTLLQNKGVSLYDVNEQGLDKIIKTSRCGVLYSALPTNAIMQREDVIVIGTIHGLRRLETPADSLCFKYRNLNWKDWLFYGLNKIMPALLRLKLCHYYMLAWKNPKFQMVTVSNHTSNAIKVFFPQLKDKTIPVFYSPSTSEYELSETVFNEKYFMLVSGNRLEKNNLRAIIALDHLFSNGFLSDFSVKVTGAKDASNFRYKIKNASRFQFLGYVNDKELDQLYHDAYCLVYPSVNEGFGYPPLEAMHYGTPVISSSYCSIPEVCGEASLYFNPFSIEEIENRLLQISNSIMHVRQKDLAIKQYAKITTKQKRDLDALVDFIYSKNEQYL